MLTGTAGVRTRPPPHLLSQLNMVNGLEGPLVAKQPAQKKPTRYTCNSLSQAESVVTVTPVLSTLLCTGTASGPLALPVFQLEVPSQLEVARSWVNF